MKVATREAYGKTLAALAKENKNIIVLDADLSGSTKTKEVKAVAPEQHYNMGIAEGNMMAVAAGLAASGNIVFASSFAMFATGRAFEQIRNSIGYPHLNVKVCASHAGLTVGEDGASHQSIELKEKGYEPTVVDMHTIKPIDKDLLVELAKSHDLFVTCEEHSVIGGLGSTVAETLSQYAPTKIKMVGVQDTFGESGTPAGLLEKYGLTSKDIVKAVIEE